MIPDLGQSPVPGARVPEGALVVSFALGAGNTVRLTVGTSQGDNDVHDEVKVLPGMISITVPTTPNLFVNAWVENIGNGTSHTYTWAWGVGTGTRTLATIGQDAILAYLTSTWSRSGIATFEHGIEIADPGHGFDEISPITYLGQPFDFENQAAHVAPFSAFEVADRDVGTGYLRCLVQPVRDPVVVTPGNPPVTRSDVSLVIEIITPSGNGPDLANQYAGALATMFRSVFLQPGEDGIDYIDTSASAPEFPVFSGEGPSFRTDTTATEFSVFSRNPLAGSQ